MRNSKWVPYLLKILWVVGLIVLAIISYDYEIQISQTASETFNFIPVFWSKPVISILFGLYISLIFVKRWSFRINPSLLWGIAIPCILLTFAFPILVSLSSAGYLSETIASSPIASSLPKVYASNVFGLIAGLSIILSLFHDQPNHKNR